MSRFFALLFTPLLLGATTTVLFDPSTPSTGPFPTDALTVSDPQQKTGLRLNLPLPPCASQYTACEETGLLEQMDGFSVRARIAVRFSAAVNTATLRTGVFYVALNNLTSEEPGIHKTGDVVAIDQVVYDPLTNTMYAKPVAALDQHRRYALVITDAVTDSAGAALAPDPAFQACLQASSAYCASLASALNSIAPSLAPRRIVGASVFTTLSATAWLEHARATLPYVPPVVMLALPQSTFHVADLATITLHEQVKTNPAAFSDISLPVSSGLLAGLDSIVLGSYMSPNFMAGDQTIPPGPTLPQLGVPDNVNIVGFNALLPSTPKPAAGYPVVIFGHGFGDSRFGGPTAVAPSLAKAGFAVVAIDAVGHGFGPESSVTFVDNAGNSRTINALGRSLDLNGDGIIESNEGCALVTPIAYGTRDCFRQTVVDLMQLARIIRSGLDLDGDGVPDLDGTHIYYAGESLGAMYGTMFMAVEPTVRAAALNVGGASAEDIARWSPAYRSLSNQALGQRIPSLLNQGSTYNEDYVLPGQPVHNVTVPGALPIQAFFDTVEWLGNSGDPIAFAPHLQTSPLTGAASRPVLMQFARQDMTVTNPANSMLIRAANLQASTWEYRHDLARAKAPDLPQDPHPYLVLFVSLNGSSVQLPGLSGLAISLDAQGQIGGFLAADGLTIPDPNQFSKLLFGFNVFEQPANLPFDFGY
ncbi:MAG TPA: Ig-like domain-containing protein [Candidatus Sulfopaludibacter sp.]|jgi:pimeloyl-ACP methyl ester carboxylesterase|nr:Ig-like domain-containing protein [Candidatus Sulfopaludibacter sp.]